MPSDITYRADYDVNTLSLHKKGLAKTSTNFFPPNDSSDCSRDNTGSYRDTTGSYLVPSTDHPNSNTILCQAATEKLDSESLAFTKATLLPPQKVAKNHQRMYKLPVYFPLVS